MKISLRSAVACIALFRIMERSHALRRRQLIQTKENQAAIEELTQNGSVNRLDRKLQVSSYLANSLPVQTFYVPLPEVSIFGQMFFQINSADARPPIESTIAIGISTDQTIIWYDHWEDGYDENVMLQTASTTEIWGDGNASNGCPPDVTPCTNSNDRLMAGDSIVIQNTVALPRNKQQIRYDGSDRIQASYPIAVTRGAYPAQPGSVLAGAVDVHDTAEWGYIFEAPIGVDVGKSFPAFELTMIFFMAAENFTKVTLPDGYVVNMNQGQGAAVSVNIGQQIRSNKPIQANLITGDMGSQYEMRWFSLVPLEMFSTDYYSPCGDTFGKTKNLIYNPGPTTTNVTVQYKLEGSNQTRTVRGLLGPKQATLSPVNPTGSAMAVAATSPIVVLSITDTENTVANGDITSGQLYEWGFPVVPVQDLTSQVLVAWGYACTQNNCYGHEDRSVVWVSPIRSADIYVDYTNSGTNYERYFVQRFESIKLRDRTDQDMSGSVIFATESGSGPYGQTVPIAVAWGQDPSVSKAFQAISMDLGSTVPPMQEVTGSKYVDRTSAYPGTVLTYTIRVMNLGQRLVQPNLLTVKDEIGDYIEYVAESTFYSSHTEGLGPTKIEDDTSGTKFPLDGNGFVIPVVISRRGGVFDLTFQVRIASIEKIKQVPIVNTGVLLSAFFSRSKRFSTRTLVLFDPAITIENTVYVGSDSGASCEVSGVELAQGVQGSPVAYCFKITNTGQSYLTDVRIRNEALSYLSTVSKVMAPGESVILVTGGFILADLQNTAIVTAVPVLKDGTKIENYDIIEDSDPSAVGKVIYKGAVAIDNTVHHGHDGGAKCSTDQTFEKVEGITNTPVTYCLIVKNTGDTFLKSVTISNTALQYTKRLSQTLAPGESVTLSIESSISGNLKNVASVSAMPVLENGSSLGLDEVNDSDFSEVEKLVFYASVLIKNSVYAGHNGGESCGTSDAVEFVGDFAGTDVTYCMEITNTGQTHLDSIRVDSPDINFHSNIPKLAPNEKHTIFVEREIKTSSVCTATVSGNPIFNDGRDLVDLVDVEDADSAEVALLSHEPSLSVRASVYSGNDDGASCGTSLAKPSVEDFFGTAAVYCFAFHNTGNTQLTSIRFVNEGLGFNKTVEGLFAPGAMHLIAVPSTITSDLSSSLVVTAHPVNDGGEAITGATDVVGSDSVNVKSVAYSPSLTVSNTVYIGEENVDDCKAKGVEFAEGRIGSSAVYCWTITNTGNSYLKNIALRNDELGFVQRNILSSPLAPGESTTVTTTSIVTRRQQNFVHATAEPCTPSGSDLLYQDVGDSDPSEVGPTPMNPSITVENKVYVGKDDGAKCGNGVETEKNTGDTYLSKVELTNSELSYENYDVSRTPMAPGDSITVSLASRLLTSIVNSANVLATPCWQAADGKCVAIPNYGDVTHVDSSEVELLTFDVSVSIENTVLLGAPTGIFGRERCPGEEHVEGYAGSDISYCFVIKNTGTSHLSDIHIASKEIVYFKTLSELLAPGGSISVAVPAIITGSVETFVNVTAAPFSIDGRKVLDHALAFDSDAASIGMIKLNPSVTITSKVYLGHDDGRSCDSNVATDEVEDSFGEAATYCFTVTNTGDSYLSELVIEDETLSFHDTSIDRLAPGESRTIVWPVTISKTLTNTAVVTAQPVLENGSDIGMEPVAASDTSKVKEVAFQPSVNVQTKVYIGDGGIERCDEAGEQVEGIAGTVITYCMQIANTGDSYLSAVQVEIQSLNYSKSFDGVFAPGESHSIAFMLPIAATAVATARVTANPTLGDGTVIPSASTVESIDAAMQNLIPYNPSIHIDNLVYIGDDGRDGCQQARDFVEGPYGETVTYCFILTNTGNTPLGSPITVNNSDLSFSQSVDQILNPGENKTVTLRGNINGDRRNIAQVTANPLQLDGNDIVGMSDVEARDPSIANQFDYVGNVKLENKVYIGDDNGAKCGTDEAIKLVRASYGSKATYCFVVKNTGDTYLSHIVLKSDKLSFTTDSFSILAPGASAIKFVVDPITVDLLNSAVVEATPTNSAGATIPDLVKVSSEDSSEVETEKHSPSVVVTNTVYLGEDGGKKCDSAEAVEYVAGKYGENVTYCFVIMNKGDTTLNEIRVENNALDVIYDQVPPLQPNGTATIAYSSKITGPLVNDVTVKANPVLPDLTDIPDLADVAANDPSEVGITVHNPSIQLQNTVYIGSVDDDLCGTDSAREYVEGTQGEVVTYCFEIRNNGDSFLSNITLSSIDLDFSKNDIDRLAPGSAATISLTSAIGGYLKNTVTVKGLPTLSDGSLIPNTSVVEDTDPSAVGETFVVGDLGNLPTIPPGGPTGISPAIAVENTVYAGSNLGLTCPGGELVEGSIGTKVVYCFLIKNIGDTYLYNIKLKNNDLGNYEDSSINALAPGGSELVAVQSSIASNLTNTAVVEGQGGTVDGIVFPNVPAVTASDTSEVRKLGAGSVRFTNKTPFAPPNRTPNECIQDKYDGSGDLICATRNVFLEGIVADDTLSCSGDGSSSITVSLEGSIRMTGGVNDLGWYIATDGGDAMTGQCIVNGLQEGNPYDVFVGVSNVAAGSVVWSSGGGDGDDCGDVIIDSTSGGSIVTPIAIELTVPCKDSNDDGTLDVAICFTWSNDSSSGWCAITDNFPAIATGECYCSRYEIPNISVTTPDHDEVTLC